MVNKLYGKEDMASSGFLSNKYNDLGINEKARIEAIFLASRNSSLKNSLNNISLNNDIINAPKRAIITNIPPIINIILEIFLNSFFAFHKLTRCNITLPVKAKRGAMSNCIDIAAEKRPKDILPYLT